MKRITEYLLAPLSAALFAGCMTTVRPLNPYSKPKPEVTITESGSIAKYFKGRELEKAGKELEEILDNDFSRVFAQEIDFAPMQYGDTGHFLVVTKKGSLDIIYSESFFSKLTPEKKKEIESLAEIYGPGWASKDLAGNEKIERPYSAYMMGKGGYALDFLLGHYIKINPDGNNLYSLVHTMAHEGTHTLIFNEMSTIYSNDFLLAYLDWIDNDEIVAIHETACNVVADNISDYFKKHHLIEGSKLYKAHERSENFRKEYKNEVSSLIKQYEALPKELRLTAGSKLIKSFEQKIKKKFNLKSFKLNEAKLAIAKRYSGNEEVNEKLNFLFDELGGENFVKLIPYLFRIEDLDKVHDQVKSGITDFRSVIEPVRDNVYLINHDEQQNLQF